MLQGYFDAKDEKAYYTRVLGTVSDRQWGNNRIDAGTVDNSLSSVVAENHWTDLQESTTYLGTAEVVTGQRFCANGSFTNRVCGAKVISLRNCLYVDGHNVCGLTRGESIDGRQLATHGDSGGPILADQNGAQVVGIISAGNVNQDGNGGNIIWFATPESACAQLRPHHCR